MSNFLPARKRIEASIDMTPLIDVVFQLLIFLMVSSQFVKPDREVELPVGREHEEEAESSKEKKNHMVTITASGELILNGVEVSLLDFEGKMRKVLTESEVKRLEIRGDTSSDLGTFITVMESAKAAGIDSVSYHKKAPEQD